jgi:predicted RNA-binding protein
MIRPSPQHFGIRFVNGRFIWVAVLLAALVGTVVSCKPAPQKSAAAPAPATAEVPPVALPAGDIHNAVMAHDIERVKQLLKADPQRVNERTEKGDTPLYVAAFLGQSPQMVPLLLQLGADFVDNQTASPTGTSMIRVTSRRLSMVYATKPALPELCACEP